MDSISDIMGLNSLESAMQVEESEFLNQILSSDDPSLFFSDSDYFSSQDANSNLLYFSQENFSTTDASSFFDALDSYQVLDTCVSNKNVEEFRNSSDLFDSFDQKPQQKRKLFSIDEVEKATKENNSISASTSDVKKKAKVDVKDKKNADIVPNIQSSSSSISEVELENASKEDKISNALNLNGCKRTTRGSAADPQSLYAKRRRARINERLRILQNLVPNGTKVDISTMLEEAVQYVKFLQLQIKVLSSDDKWMYAPLAYNGIDIGLDLNRDLPWRQQ